MQGTILGWNPAKHIGVITAVTGQRLKFHLSDWQHGAAQMPQAGAQVEFDLDVDHARNVRQTAATPGRASASSTGARPHCTQTTAPPPPQQVIPPPPPPRDLGKSASDFAGYSCSVGFVLMLLCACGINSLIEQDPAFGANTLAWSTTSFFIGLLSLVIGFISSIVALAVSGGTKGWGDLIATTIALLIVIGVVNTSVAALTLLFGL